ncbi:MAG: ACT domain-containing protein [Lentisphaeria bacterium]|nr:ACT domain-containing protein [Lentisphaeria bacterium]
MKIKQLSVFLENRAGRLAHVTRVLSDAGINILALSLADTSDFGILRIIVDDPARADTVLKKQNVVSMLNDVTAVEVDNRPGGLYRILATLEGSGVNVEYMYAFAEPRSQKAALIFRFDAPDKAVKVLGDAGINIFAHIDLGMQPHG